ncbi:MAG: hypothetical protein ACREQY_15535 [Candidatus Binatia bacterium]
MDEAKSAEAQIKEAAWTYTGWAVLLILVFLGGVGLAYTQWGDAPRLRRHVQELTATISGIRTERENLQHSVGRCERELEALKERTAAAPPG